MSKVKFTKGDSVKHVHLSEGVRKELEAAGWEAEKAPKKKYKKED